MKLLIKPIIFLVALALNTGMLNARNQSDDEFYKQVAYKQYKRASEQISSADEVENIFRTGYLKLKQGDIKEARSSFLSGINLHPKEAKFYAGMGAVELASDETNTLGSDYFSKALQLGKKDADVYFIIAEAYVSAQIKLTEALDYVEKALELTPGQARLLMLKGDILLSMKDAGKAISSYEEAFETDATNALPYYKIGKLYLGGRNIPRAEEAFLKALNADPTFADVHKELAEIAYTKKDMATAKNYYQQFLKSSEVVSADIKGRYGYICFLSKDYNNAIVAFDEVLKEEPENNLILKYRAYSLSEQNANEAAEEAFNYYFSKTPAENRDWKDAELYGKLLIKLNKADKAIEILSEALASNPASVELVQLLGETSFKLKKYDLASTYYTRLIKLRSVAHPQDHFVLGRSYYAQEAYNQADSAFSVLVQMQPQSVTAFLWKARAQSNLDPESENGLAKPTYEKVIELAQADVTKHQTELEEAHAYLGYYFYLKKDLPTSLMHWQMVAKFNPNNEQAREAISAISN